MQVVVADSVGVSQQSSQRSAGISGLGKRGHHHISVYRQRRSKEVILPLSVTVMRLMLECCI